MITLDTVIQQLHIWDGQILLFIQEYIRHDWMDWFRNICVWKH